IEKFKNKISSDINSENFFKDNATLTEVKDFTDVKSRVDKFIESLSAITYKEIFVHFREQLKAFEDQFHELRQKSFAEPALAVGRSNESKVGQLHGLLTPHNQNQRKDPIKPTQSSSTRCSQVRYKPYKKQ
ncbi:hypothetical protein OAC51_08790, partial [Flavobacteriaceae bacterium]|nr:hypothetical protein [Flavobacteriaceae bacterium]